MLDRLLPQQATASGHATCPGALVSQRSLLGGHPLLSSNNTCREDYTGDPTTPAFHIRVLHHFPCAQSFHNLCVT